jgi:hypothetical protein
MSDYFVQSKFNQAADRIDKENINKTADPSDGCSTWLREGLFMNHESVTANGSSYFCAHCDVNLSGPNVNPESEQSK